MTTNVLNLYAGIGGNRKLWEDVDVTAVEWDEEKAEVYQDHFPKDEVVVTDAHDYLENHISDEWDFIWASPPCPTHSRMNHINHSQHGVNYPDMKLWQEVIVLQTHAERLGFDYCVENVKTYYQPLYKPQVVGEHYLWSNFHIPNVEFPSRGIRTGGTENTIGFDYDEYQEKYGYDLSKYDVAKSKKEKALRNCVEPRLGKHVFEAATSDRQVTFAEVTG